MGVSTKLSGWRRSHVLFEKWDGNMPPSLGRGVQAWTRSVWRESRIVSQALATNEQPLKLPVMVVALSQDPIQLESLGR